MKLLIVFLLLLSFLGCGPGNGLRSKDEYFTQITARVQANPPIILAPVDVAALFGPPNESGNRAGGNLYYRYNVSEGGFVEIEFLNNIFNAISIPSTY